MLTDVCYPGLSAQKHIQVMTNCKHIVNAFTIQNSTNIQDLSLQGKFFEIQRIVCTAETEQVRRDDTISPADKVVDLMAPVK